MVKAKDLKTIEINDEGTLRTITFKEINLEKKDAKAVKIALIQIKGPEYNIGWKERGVSYFNKEDDLLGFFDDNFQMRRNIVDCQIKKIKKLVDYAIEDEAEILCLPSMVIPEELDNIFNEISRKKEVVIISGFEYIKDEKKDLNNIVNLYFPGISSECIKFVYSKIFKSKYDPKIKTGDVVYIYTHTGFGTFTVLNCFDYTNIDLLNEINKFKVDIIFVISHNPAFRMFHNYGIADSHRYYAYIVIVNSGDFGGSAIYAPIRKEGNLNIHNYLRGLRGKGDGIITQNIDARDLNASRKRTIPGWMNPPKIEDDEKLINVEKINLKQELKTNEILISLIELRAPDAKDYQKNNWKFTATYRKEIKNEIKKILQNLKDKKINFIIFPEVSLPEGIEKTLFQFSKENGVYIMGGFEYNNKTQNRCKIFTPHTPDESDFSKYPNILYRSKDIHYYYYTKIFQSKYDHPSMDKGNKLIIFENSLFGDFAPIICFDYSHNSILEKLAKKVDLLFVSSYNPDVEIYHNYGQADCHRLYCYISQCNVSTFGGSAVYGPIRRIDNVRSNSILGQLIGSSKDKTRILIVEVEIKSLRGEEESHRLRFYSPPAGYRSK